MECCVINEIPAVGRADRDVSPIKILVAYVQRIPGMYEAR